MWCKVLSCIGKMTLAKPKGFLLLKPSALHQPPSAPLPSPNCVFRPAMKHSDRAAARGFKLSPCTLGGGGQDPAKGEAGVVVVVVAACIFSQLPVGFPLCLQAAEHACCIDSGKVQPERSAAAR